MRISTKTFLLSTVALFSLFFSSCKNNDDNSVIVKTFHVTNANPTSGTFRGTVTVVDADIIDAGIIYSSTLVYPRMATGKHVSQTNGSFKDFTIVLTGLSADSTYQFRAYAKTPDSTYYGTVYSYKPVSISIETVLVPGGTFAMGASNEQPVSALANEKPVHQVTLGNFYIGQKEITNAQFALFLNSRYILENGRGMTANGTIQQLVIKNLKGLQYNATIYKWQVSKEYENLPVVNVTWFGASEFCLWAGGRLPTEAEWEFAARGGADGGTIYSGSNNPDDVAWYKPQILDMSCPVQLGGGKAANGLKIYDMSGNVWEWVADWYNTYPSNNLLNPTGLTDTEAKNAKIVGKVRRGGGWADPDASTLRVSSRASSKAEVPAGSLGFRFAKNAN